MNGDHTSRIRVIIDNIVNNEKEVNRILNQYNALDNVNKSMVKTAQRQVSVQDALTNKQGFYATQMERMGVNGAQLDRMLSSLGATWDKNGNLIQKNGEQFEDLESQLNKAKIATKGFNMNLLSTMFFGMSLQRMFNGLLKTSLEWMGIQELMNVTLGVFFLPIAEEMLNLLLPIMDWFMNIPEPMQKFIGMIALVGSALGAAMMAFGTLGLGMQGLGQTFGIETSKGIISGLKSKLSGIDISKYLKYGAATIAFGLALQDGAEGELTAAIGDTMVGAGFLAQGTKYAGVGKWVMVAGIALKVVGDDEAGEKISKIMIKIVDTAYRAAESIGGLFENLWKGITTGEFNFEGFDNFKNTMGAKFEEMAIKGELSSKALTNSFSGVDYSMESLSKSQIELKERYDANLISQEEYASGLDDLNNKYSYAIDYMERYNELLKEAKIMMDNLSKSRPDLVSTNIFGMKSFNFPTNDQGMSYAYNLQDAIISPNGNILSTAPDDYLIATKDPYGLANGGSNGGEQVINITYNLTASSRSEFESMLRESERRITQDIRRQAR